MISMSPKARIVSIVPSLTHMVCDLGLKSQIVGCTSFCVDPPDLPRTATLIGGTKNPDLESIAALNPTHILVNEEENKREHILGCERIAATFSTFPKSPHDVPSLIRGVATWLGVEPAGESWAAKIERKLGDFSVLAPIGFWSGKRCLYLIWRQPYMLVSQGTYIDAMLKILGLENAAPSSERYPALSMQNIKQLAPDIVFFSSEPYPFRWRDIERFQAEWGEQSPQSIPMPICRKIDGKLLSWYGTMTFDGLSYLADLEHGIS